MKRILILIVLMLFAGCTQKLTFSPAPAISDKGRSAEIYVIRDMTEVTLGEAQKGPTYWVVCLDDANIGMLEKGQYTKFSAEAGNFAEIGLQKWVYWWQKDAKTIILEPDREYYFKASVADSALKIDIQELTKEEAAGMLAKSSFSPPEE